ncbi:MAG: metalloregulator ArsR/SmtB family transcription factor [Rhodospirillales bacterium]|nr:metalloregulator ArsR/SmtB family transcription factor [Rhodospirillales bacterium]
MASSRAQRRRVSIRGFEPIAERLRAVGHAQRLMALDVLADGEATVGELAGAIHQPHAITSQHLQVLRLHGLVARRREGKRMVYRLADDEARELVHFLRMRRYRTDDVGPGEAI